MAEGSELKMKVFNRPIKPVAFGLTGLMLTLFWFNFVENDLFQGALLGQLVSIFSFTAAVTLTFGWVFRSQSMAEAGLLLAGGVYLSRAIFIVIYAGFIDGITVRDFWLSLCACSIAFGSFLLERRGEDTWTL